MDRLDRYHPLAAEHVTAPRNPGRLEAPDAEAEASNPACGDRLLLTLALEAGRVREARFQAEGCAATLAAGSCLTEWLTGRSLSEVRELAPGTLDALLGGLPPDRFHAVELACRVTHRALGETS